MQTEAVKKNGNVINVKDDYTIKGLAPDSEEYLYLSLLLNGEVVCEGHSAWFKTDGLNIEVTSNSTTPTTTNVEGSYTQGDAIIASTSIQFNGETIKGDNAIFVGLEPNKKYTAKYKVVAVYDANARRIAKPQRGLNILKMSDGTVRKIVVQ